MNAWISYTISKLKKNSNEAVIDKTIKNLKYLKIFGNLQYFQKIKKKIWFFGPP